MTAPAKNDDASVLGIRATWTCARCQATAVSRQIAPIEHAPDIGVVIVLDLPEDWKAKGHETFCPAHKKPGARGL